MKKTKRTFRMEGRTLTTDDLDGLYQELQKKGVRFAAPPPDEFEARLPNRRI